MEPDGFIADETKKRADLSSSPEGDKYDDAKTSKIRDAIQWRDLETLRALATSEGGFVSDEVRRQACSYLQEYYCAGN